MNSSAVRHKETNLEFLVVLARAFGGAIIFSIPVLMTMEMWQLGFYISGWRLAIFTVLILPLLAGMSYFAGFEDAATVKDDILDTFVAYAVGFVASAVILLAFGVISFQMPLEEIVGKISLQAITASLGAVFTESSLNRGSGSNQDSAEERKRSSAYGGQLFLMVAGAVYLSMSVAPTEEMILISFKMSNWHTVALVILTLLITYGFSRACESVEDNDKSRKSDKTHTQSLSFWSVFLRRTVVSYSIALLISAAVMWIFGQIDGMNAETALKSVIVLAFPAALGAAAARLIL